MAKSRYDYVKQFELDDRLLPGCWFAVRLDGRQFRTFVEKHRLHKPVDDRGIALMNRCACEVMKRFSDIVIAVGASDEYSFVFHRETQLFSRRASKILTTIVSEFSSRFVYHWSEYFGPGTTPFMYPKPDGTLLQYQPPKVSQGGSTVSDGKAPPCSAAPSAAEVDWTRELIYPPTFDGRIVLYPTDDSIKDYLRWRQNDFHVNNIYNVCYWSLLHDGVTPHEAELTLMNTGTEQKNELLFSRFNLNYAKLPAAHRKGSIIIWQEVEEAATTDESKMDRTNASVNPAIRDSAGTGASPDDNDMTVGDEKSSIDEPKVAKPAKPTIFTPGRKPKVLQIYHEDLVGEKFFNDHPGIIPYISPAEIQRAIARERRKEKKRLAQHQQGQHQQGQHQADPTSAPNANEE